MHLIHYSNAEIRALLAVFKKVWGTSSMSYTDAVPHSLTIVLNYLKHHFTLTIRKLSKNISTTVFAFSEGFLVYKPSSLLFLSKSS